MIKDIIRALFSTLKDIAVVVLLVTAGVFLGILTIGFGAYLVSLAI